MARPGSPTQHLARDMLSLIAANLNDRLSQFVSRNPMPTVKIRATTILGEFEQAQTELVDKAVILTDGKCGTVDKVWLDELHGLRISIRGHDGKWPVSTVKFTQTGPVSNLQGK
jgi:hypothetical protein